MAKKPSALVLEEKIVERYDLEEGGYSAKCGACGKKLKMAQDREELFHIVGLHAAKCDCDPVEDIDVLRHYEFVEIDDDEEVEVEDADEDEEEEEEDEVDEEEEVVEKKKKDPATVEDVDDEEDDDVEDGENGEKGKDKDPENGDIDGGELD